jgi:FixJ family two-component response regulator
MSDRRVVALIDDDVAVLDSLKFLLELDGYPVAPTLRRPRSWPIE